MELQAEIRTATGKKVHTLRRDGFIPGELYGHNVPNRHLTVRFQDFMRVFKDAGATTLVTLHVGDEKHPVLIHSVQRDYLSNTVMHVDFYEVSLTEAIRAKVPLEFVGEAPAVKEQGGILNKAVADLEVEALPDKLPHRIFVPLERLRDLNQSLYVRDLEIPKDVTVLAEPETVVVTVTLPLAEEEQPAAPVDVATVKVEAEEKKAKRAQERDVQGKEAA